MKENAHCQCPVNPSQASEAFLIESQLTERICTLGCEPLFHADSISIYRKDHSGPKQSTTDRIFLHSTHFIIPSIEMSQCLGIISPIRSRTADRNILPCEGLTAHSNVYTIGSIIRASQTCVQATAQTKVSG